MSTQRCPRGQEIASSIIHAAGAVLSPTGLTAIVIYASLCGSAKHIVDCAVFGAAPVFLYTSSTLYHIFRPAPLKHIFRVIDHSCIYLLKKVPFNHAVCHVCVLAGNAFHYFAVMRCVVPPVA